MNRSLISALIVLTVLVQPVVAQRLLTEMAIPRPDFFRSVQGTALGDSIFLAVQENNSFSTAFVISPDGQQRRLDIRALRNKVICGITEQAKRIYFFDQERKQVIVKCMETDLLHGNGTILGGQVAIPGKILGSYTEHNDLFVICAEKKSYMLKILQIRDDFIVDERKFSLSHSLLDQHDLTRAFILAGTYIKPEQAMANIKLFKFPQEIYITIDDVPRKYYSEDTEPKGSVYSTTVIRIDLRTEEVKVRSYFESTRHNFCTYVFDNHVYRLINGTELVVWDFSTDRLLGKIQFTKENFPAYGTQRNGVDNSVLLRVKNIAPGGNFILVDSLPAGRILTVGSFNEKAMVVPVVSGLGLLVSLVSVVGSLAINELSDGPYITTYSYLNETGFTPLQSKGPLRMTLDSFEASKDQYRYKGYLQYAGGIYAVYREKRSDVLKIIRFDED